MANLAFAERLREAREQSSLKAVDIARRLGVSKQLVSHWEHGRSDVSTEHLADLAGLLGVDLTWLLTGSSSAPNAAV
ncbi:MAG: hypothetical protein RLZ98_3608, partial [Pseudomonadota bacterium]